MDLPIEDQESDEWGKIDSYCVIQMSAHLEPTQYPSMT